VECCPGLEYVLDMLSMRIPRRMKKSFLKVGFEDSEKGFTAGSANVSNNLRAKALFLVIVDFDAPTRVAIRAERSGLFRQARAETA
jgi:hypothetical protein